MKNVIVNENDKGKRLDIYIAENFNELSRTMIKKLIESNNILVNDKSEKVSYKVQANDNISIDVPEAKETKLKAQEIPLDIIYEDKDIIVINKPSGLLTVATEKEKNKTAYHLVMEYLKKKNKNNRIFIIHRLDKDTSGIIMFAKNERAKHLYQDNWNDIVKKRCYYAVIDGKMENKEGTIKSYLKENGNMVYSVKDRSGKLAITEYKVLKERKNISLLDINLKTGRKNQIRVHMKENKTPILGDLKYGEKSKLINRLALHAYKLELVNPVTKKLLTFEINMPNEFKMLFK